MLLLMLSSCAAPPVATPLTLSDANGTSHHPLEAHGTKAIAFIFVGIDCPISNGYAPEINRIISEYSKQEITFYVVYPDAGATPAAVRTHAHDFGYACPALLDPRHQLADYVHATVTPQAAVLSPDGRLLYRGRIDDLYAELGKRRYAATTHDLRDALDAIVHDRAVVIKTTRAIGCEI
jgi:hypothetical protein